MSKTTNQLLFGDGLKARLEEHILQMSLYRWLDAARDKPRITEPYGKINYIFTDWSKSNAPYSNYPELRVMDKTIPLMELDEVSLD